MANKGTGPRTLSRTVCEFCASDWTFKRCNFRLHKHVSIESDSTMPPRQWYFVNFNLGFCPDKVEYQTLMCSSHFLTAQVETCILVVSITFLLVLSLLYLALQLYIAIISSHSFFLAVNHFVGCINSEWKSECFSFLLHIFRHLAVEAESEQWL